MDLFNINEKEQLNILLNVFDAKMTIEMGKSFVYFGYTVQKLNYSERYIHSYSYCKNNASSVLDYWIIEVSNDLLMHLLDYFKTELNNSPVSFTIHKYIDGDGWETPRYGYEYEFDVLDKKLFDTLCNMFGEHNIVEYIEKCEQNPDVEDILYAFLEI